MTDSFSLHKYLYANTNPINVIDPTGFFSLTEIQAASKGFSILQGLNLSVNLSFYLIDGATGNYAGLATSFATDVGALLLGGPAVSTPKNISRATTILGKFFSRGKKFVVNSTDLSGSALSHNLTEFGFVKSAGEAAHHIVAATAKNEYAVRARDILKKWDIDLNSPINGIFLPGKNSPLNKKGARHTGKHLDTYYQKVARKLDSYNAQDDKSGAYRALIELRNELRLGELKTNNF